jgi:hypothetical protein
MNRSFCKNHKQEKQSLISNIGTFFIKKNSIVIIIIAVCNSWHPNFKFWYVEQYSDGLRRHIDRKYKCNCHFKHSLLYFFLSKNETKFLDFGYSPKNIFGFQIKKYYLFISKKI